MDLSSLTGAAGTLVLGAGVVAWLVKREMALQKELRELHDARRRDWKMQAEMNLQAQRMLDKAAQAYQRLTGRSLSPPPSSSGMPPRSGT